MAVKSKGSWARISMGHETLIVTALAAPLAMAHPMAALAAGDAEHGVKVYQDCMLCHSLDKNEVGPRHRGVFGRKAAALRDYDYSAALKASKLTWDEPTLDKWLTDPSALVPGTKMIFSVDDAQDRSDVIAFLKEKAVGTAGGTK